MNLSYDLLTRLIDGFNQTAHDESDFWRICNALGIDAQERPLNKRGYYVSDSSGSYIFIDEKLRGAKRLEVQFHELAHAILDEPCPFLHERHQQQAEVFALIFLIPRDDLPELSETPPDEIDYRIQPFIKRRLQIYKEFGL